MKPLFCIAMLLGTASLSACAQAPQPEAAAKPAAEAAAPRPASATKVAAAKPGSADAVARDALAKLNPQIQVDYVGAAPMPGFRELIVGGQLVYVSDDGKYLFQGSVVDLASKSDLTQSSQALSHYRQDLLASAKTADRIVFAPATTKSLYTVSVFTDIECGYCRKLHSEIAEYNRRGITIEYLAFPRNGLGSKDHHDMVSVWCAADRNQALTQAKNGKSVTAKECQSPVEAQFALGQRLGVTGTPAVYAPDGTQLGGYLPPQAMREALDRLAPKAAGMK